MSWNWHLNDSASFPQRIDKPSHDGSANPATPQACSPYLAQITQRTQAANAAIGVAIDLSNVISERTGSGELAASAVIREHGVSVDQTARAFAGLQGVTLLITVGERLEGTLTIDFNQDISFLAPAAGPLVLEHFQRLGASMEQWKGWQATASGTALTMAGELTASDLRKVFGLFRLSQTQPVQVASEPPKQPTPPGSSPFNATADLTRRYFESIVRSVTELQGSMTGASPYQFALWVDTCASGRIEMLPQGMVDPEVVKFGNSVSSQLRNLLACSPPTGSLSMARTAPDRCPSPLHLRLLADRPHSELRRISDARVCAVRIRAGGPD